MQKPLSSRSIAFVVAGAACLVPPRSDAAPFVEPDVQVLYTTHAENPGDDYGWAAERIGDLDGDGAAEIITAPGPWHTPLVRVFHTYDNGALGELSAFYAYDAGFNGGVFVAAPR